MPTDAAENGGGNLAVPAGLAGTGTGFCTMGSLGIGAFGAAEPGIAVATALAGAETGLPETCDDIGFATAGVAVVGFPLTGAVAPGRTAPGFLAALAAGFDAFVTLPATGAELRPFAALAAAAAAAAFGLEDGAPGCCIRCGAGFVEAATAGGFVDWC